MNNGSISGFPSRQLPFILSLASDQKLNSPMFDDALADSHELKSIETIVWTRKCIVTRLGGIFRGKLINQLTTRSFRSSKRLRIDLLGCELTASPGRDQVVPNLKLISNR